MTACPFVRVGRAANGPRSPERPFFPHGTSAAQGTARKEIPGLAEDPRFWASGISLVAHMRSPLTPAVHMNTRMFWTPHGSWFGGGADLNPAIEDAADTAFFHDALKRACDPEALLQTDLAKRLFPEMFAEPQ